MSSKRFFRTYVYYNEKSDILILLHNRNNKRLFCISVMNYYNNIYNTIIPIINHYFGGKILSDLFEELNKSQKEAVSSTEGFIRVIAGAGSGKTKALANRFAYLVNELGVLPSDILCVTFTNKSANEMRQRIHNLTGDNDTGFINTFHGFCVSILQEDSHAVSYPKSFIVLDNSDIDSILKIIYEERGLSLRTMTFSSARDMIELRKIFKEPKYYLDMITMSLDTLHKKYLDATSGEDIIFYGYLYQEKKSFALDYNDLIKFSLYIFEENEEIKVKWQKRLEYIMIDEFQDIDSLQYSLMEVLCNYHKNLFIVGDPDQTIYTWRGANVKYLLDFDKAFPKVKTIMMNDNYRSTPEILAVSNSLISRNTNRIKKDLAPILENGDPVECSFLANSDGEASWISDKILSLQSSGTPFKDNTILYRAHYVTRAIEEALIKAKIPYVIYSGVQFFGRLEIKDALSYLKMIAYKDDLSFIRIVNVPKRNLGIRRMNYLKAYAASNSVSLYEALVAAVSSNNDLFKRTGAENFIKLIEKFASEYLDTPISDVLSQILNESGYEEMLRTEGAQDRLDNLAELKQSVFNYETTCGEETNLESYLKHIVLFTNTDCADSSSDKVKLMTVHTAKGLEFPNVFLCGMNEGIFPSRKTKTLEGMEEERRLAFVALTRAQKKLFLTEAAGRNFDGSPRYPSRFILDIDPKLLFFAKAPDEKLIKETRNYLKLTNRFLEELDQNDLIPIDTRINHRIFGDGTIKNYDINKQAYLIKFDELDTERALSFKIKLSEI